MHAELLSHCAQIRPTLMALAGLSFLTFRGGGGGGATYCSICSKVLLLP